MSTSFKPQPQIRQHGFHLPSPPREDEYSTNDIQDSFRQPPLDFTDELVSLMSSEKQQQGQPQQQQQQQQQQYDDYRPQTTHNIFDISAPNMGQHHFALNPTNTSHHDSSRLDFPSHFNSTLPALNSSMRYEPHPDPPISGFRPNSRSRSRSRPPTNTSVGPVRTRRGNSVSSSVGGAPSPPPGNRPHPHAIVIPGSHPRPGTSNSSWLSNGQDPYSLPTPESLHSPSLLSSHNQYSPFGFSPSNHHHDHAAYGSLPSHHNLAISPITGGINTLGFATSPVTPTPSSVPTHSAAIPTPSSSSSSATPTTNGTSTAASAQSAAEKLANEKRRRRRESHNAVERRRRDNINERIGELATLIPECMLNDTPPSHATPDDGDEGASPPVKERNPNSGMKKGEDGVVKANKGMILRKSVDYIRYLQELVDAQGQRNRQLEHELKAYRSGTVPPVSSSSPTTTPVMPTLPGSSSVQGTNGLVSFGEDEWMDVDSSAQYGILGYPLSNSKSHSRSTARGSDSGGSPLTQIEEDDSEDEEERGRATRSRRVKKEA